MYGLTARRWAIDTFNITPFFQDGFGLWIVVALIVLSYSCKEKSEAQDMAGHKSKKEIAVADSLNKPKVSIKVNRHYDGKGNLVGFDSTYSSYYSNMQGDTSRMDSLMKSFDTYFNRKHSLLLDKQFNNLFFNDTIRYPDFFHKDFFMHRYELNDLYMRDMMRDMDSVKNRFFSERSRQRKNSKKTFKINC
jgi:hypothetical protein